MNIQIDTKNKKIKIEEEVNLGELVNALKSLLPNNAWKDFTLYPWIDIPLPYTYGNTGGNVLNSNNKGNVLDSTSINSGIQLKSGTFNVIY